MLTITRKLEFDAGHRLPDHRSLCRNVHGHRYTLEVTLSGEPIQTANAPDCGMVMDFGQIKSLALEHLVNAWDHAFFVYRDDTLTRQFLESLPDHKTIVVEHPPTVENLAAIAFDTLASVYDAHYGKKLRLKKIRLYETPNCWADIEKP